MGAVIKCLAVYDEPFWRARGPVAARRRSDTGPVTLIVRQLTAGRARRASWSASWRATGRASWARAGHRSAAPRWSAAFARLFGPRAARPSATWSKLWADEEWSRGCYVGYTPPGVLTAFGPALREPVGPIHWAGTETATVWNGYMDGAVRSGELAAAQALERM